MIIGYSKLQSIAVLTLLLVSLTPLSTLAQNSSSVQFGKPAKVRPQNVAATEKLSQKVAINGLPDYSGKQTFVGGRTHNTPIGPQYSEEFIAMETPNQIIDWYKGALSGYKWEIVDSDPSRVHAKKPDGSTITVSVNPYKSPKGRSLVKINYHDYHIPNGSNQ